MALIRWEPVRELGTIQNEMNRLFNTLFETPTAGNGSSTAIDYSCGGAGFGHSEITVLTPRSLRIETQGISDGLPFNYVLQARRVDDCPKSASVARH